MERPYIRVLVLTALLLLAVVAAGCSVRRDTLPTSTGVGPYPLGVSVQSNHYSIRLRAVNVRAGDSLSLSQRTDTDPNALPDTSTPDPDGMPLVSAFLVSAGDPPRANARPGYRFVDALVAIRGRTESATVDLRQDVVTTATVIAAGKSYSLRDRNLGFTYGSPVLHDTLEFEVPETATEAVLALGLKDETQTVRFRLW